MRPIRTCDGSHLNTGLSRCPVDFDRMIGAIIVPYGTKLPATITSDALTKLAHAAVSERIYGITPFCEYAQEGGEAQTGAVGYGGLKVTGYSDRFDTFTLDKNYPELHASLTRCAGKQWGAYFYDKNFFLYGLNDGTDTLAPFPMSTIHSNSTPYSTSSARSTMTVKFCHEDARAAIENADYMRLDFNPQRSVLGLTPVILAKTGSSGNKYKILEDVGGYDLTATFGQLIADTANVVANATAATYDDEDQTLTLTATTGKTPHLKDPSVLLEAGIEGIEDVTQISAMNRFQIGGGFLPVSPVK